MAPEIYWLVLTAVLSSLLFVPYAVVRIRKIGLKVFSNPLPGDDPFEQAWAHRAYRAHMNAYENLVTFAPIALAVVLTGSSNEITAMAAQVFFWSRLVHAPFYIIKTPFVRTIAYFIGLIAMLVMAWQVLSHIS